MPDNTAPTFSSYVHDLHYGWARVLERFEVVSMVRWEEAGTRHWRDALDLLVKAGDNCRSYTNKYLVVINVAVDPASGDTIYVCGWCYDGHDCGLVSLKARG